MNLAVCASDTQSFFDAIQHLTIGGGIVLAIAVLAVAWVVVTFIRAIF